MINFNEALKLVKSELDSDNAVERTEFLRHFTDERDVFARGMAKAYVAWQKFDNEIQGNEKKAYVAGLVWSAMMLHVVSMKLLLAGYQIPAGNLERQVIETIALTLLCSDKKLGILDKYIEQEYSTNKSVASLKKKAHHLGLNDAFLKVIETSWNFYHRFSHPTVLSLASLIPFSKNTICSGIGASSYDPEKLEIYGKEISHRVSLANEFVNFVEGITVSVSKWKATS